jgi:hypothetical protein
VQYEETGQRDLATGAFKPAVGAFTDEFMVVKTANRTRAPQAHAAASD